MSKRYPGWTFSTGVRLANQNLSFGAAEIEFPDGSLVDMSLSNVLLFLQVPVVFGYDFRFGEKQALRLDFGLFYQRYLYGANYIGGQFAGAMEYYDYPMHDNVGWNSGIRYYVNDFFIGLDLNLLFDWAFDFAAYNSLSATIGYRF